MRYMSVLYRSGARASAKKYSRNITRHLFPDILFGNLHFPGKNIDKVQDILLSRDE
jgi:hypothetical protein